MNSDIDLPNLPLQHPVVVVIVEVDNLSRHSTSINLGLPFNMPKHFSRASDSDDQTTGNLEISVDAPRDVVAACQDQKKQKILGTIHRQ